MAKIVWKSADEITQEIHLEQQKQERIEKQQQAENIIVEKMASDYILSSEVSDEEKDLFTNLFNLWEPGTEYTPGNKVVYNDLVYEVIQPHTSQSDWLPNEVPALYKLFYQTSTDDGTIVIPEWKQPLGGHDAYNTGDLVSYNESIWESDVDGNVWAPGVYGWTMID